MRDGAADSIPEMVTREKCEMAGGKLAWSVTERGVTELRAMMSTESQRICDCLMGV
jgi:hypothetical protein